MSNSQWNELNIEKLLALTEIGPGHWRTRHGDSNPNGRSYGGQLLAQALMAGVRSVPHDRVPATMQFMFLQGAMPQELIDLHVTSLQEGKRFSTRHVRGSQTNGRVVLDAQLMCSTQMQAPSHGAPSRAPKGERPQDLAQLSDVEPMLLQGLGRLGGYSNVQKSSIEFRIPDPKGQLSTDTMDGRFRFWIRPTHALPEDLRIHAGVLAYLSDWWVNFCTLGQHLSEMGERRLYIASLNHSIWFHRLFRSDQWLHIDTVSPVSASGRGLCIASVHDGEGLALATITQECLMAYAE